jgi:hypothetical protein
MAGMSSSLETPVTLSVVRMLSIPIVLRTRPRPATRPVRLLSSARRCRTCTFRSSAATWVPIGGAEATEVGGQGIPGCMGGGPPCGFQGGGIGPTGCIIGGAGGGMAPIGGPGIATGPGGAGGRPGDW